VTACRHYGKLLQHGKPQRREARSQPDSREGQAGPPGVADRLVVPRKPGNSGGGKEPEFKEAARRGKGQGEWCKPRNLPIKGSRSEGVGPQSLWFCVSLSESRMREIRTSWFDERGVETERQPPLHIYSSSYIWLTVLRAERILWPLVQEREAGYGREVTREWSGEPPSFSSTTGTLSRGHR
jgi:hypothetical protein